MKSEVSDGNYAIQGGEEMPDNAQKNPCQIMGGNGLVGIRTSDLCNWKLLYEVDHRGAAVSHKSARLSPVPGVIR